jgi:hypothetical protein
MKKSAILISLFAVVLFSGCTKSDYDLEKSIYMPDENYSSLPAYSEWGYNTFGAFYERKIFLYSNNEIPAKVIRTNGQTRFVLKGGLVPSGYNDRYYNGYYYFTNVMSLSFELPGFEPDDYTDLANLNGLSYDLSDPELSVTAIIDNDTVDLPVINGTLQFKKAQHLFVDGQAVKVILSGNFGFQALVKGEPVSMSYGRFDVGIDEYEFASY